jgi:DNA-binding SARP family transcriptional activator/predicted negative regulator of RcsB-dependent stress response
MVRVYLLGPLRVQLDEGEANLPSSRKARLLLAMLALERRPHGRSELAGRLWPEVPEESARVSLRTELSKLRGALGEAASAVIVAGPGGSVAIAGDVWTDVAEAESLLTSDAEAAADRCALELLAGLDDDWVLERRDQMRDRCADAVASAAAQAERAGDLDAAVRLSRKAAALDPLAEARQHELIRRLAASGDRVAALAAYKRFRGRLAEELRITPSAEIRTLIDKIRREQDEPAAAAFPLPRLFLPGPRGPFAGRSRELAALQAEWKRARRGEVRLVVVSGEPGIGKTRLAAEFCEAAHSAGALVLLGRCHENAPIPYEPFAEALGRYIAALPSEWLQRQSGVLAAALAALVPELAERIGSDPPALQEVEQARLVTAITVLLRQAARSRPAILFLEDLHWADDATTTVLRHLVHRAEDVPLLILATYRSTEIDEDHAAAAVLAEARHSRALTEVSLTGLDASAVATIIAAKAGERASLELSAALHARSEGNPFFVEELLRDTHELASPDQLALPQVITDVVLRRLRRLDREAVRLLETAAVIGQEFSLPVLGQAAGTSRERLLDVLDGALMAHAVMPATDPGGYAFAHALVYEVVYDRLSPARRADLHQRVGEAIASLSPRDDRALAATLARHFSAAGDHARAFEHHVESARAAARVGALTEGLGHCDAAREANRALGREGQTGARAAVIAFERGRLLHRAGRCDEALATLEQALAGARETGDSSLELETLMELGQVWRNVDVRRAPQVLQAALTLAGRLSDTAAQVRSLSRSSLVHADQLQLDRAAVDGRRALLLARRSGDERLVAQALDAQKLVAWQLGDTTRLGRITDELEAIQRRHGEHWYLCWTLLEGAQVPIAALRWPEAQARLEEALALAEEIGASGAAALILDSLAVIEEARGSPEAALARCGRALELLRTVRTASFVGWVEATAGLVLLRLHAPEQAAERLAHGLEMAKRAGSCHEMLRCTALLARALLAAGNKPQALRLAERAEAMWRQASTPRGHQLLYLGTAIAAGAEVLAAAGFPERGQRLVATSLQAAQSPRKAWFAIPLSIAMARCLAAQGDYDAAQRALAPAVAAALARTFAPAWEALALLAQVQRAAGHLDEAQASQAEAHAAFTAATAGIADDSLRAGLATALNLEPVLIKAPVPT